MKIRLTVSIDLDLDGYRDEYGEHFPPEEARDRIRQDLIAALYAGPYEDALRKVEVK